MYYHSGYCESLKVDFHNIENDEILKKSPINCIFITTELFLTSVIKFYFLLLSSNAPIKTCHLITLSSLHLHLQFLVGFFWFWGGFFGDFFFPQLDAASEMMSVGAACETL